MYSSTTEVVNVLVISSPAIKLYIILCHKLKNSNTEKYIVLCKQHLLSTVIWRVLTVLYVSLSTHTQIYTLNITVSGIHNICFSCSFLLTARQPARAWTQRLFFRHWACLSLRLICSLSRFNVAQDCLYYRGFFCFPFLYAPLLSPIPPFFIRCCIKNFV